MTPFDYIMVRAVSLTLFLIPWQTAYFFEPSRVGTFEVLSFTLLDALIAALIIGVLARECLHTIQNGIRAQWVKAWSFARKPLVVLSFAFIVYAALSALWSVQRPFALMGALRLFEALVLYAILLRYHSHQRMFACSIVCAASIQALFAISQFFLQESPAFSWLGLAYHSSQQLGDAVVEVGDQRWLRAYGSFPHPNVLGALLSFGLFSCAYLMRAAASKKIVWVLLAVWCSILIGLFFTFSREVWIGTIIGFAIAAYAGRKIRWKGEGISPLAMAFALGIFTIASLAIVHWEPLSGRLGINGQGRLEQKSINERIASYEDGWSLVRSSPLLGVGMYQSVTALLQHDADVGVSASSYAYQPPHNLFLLIGAELGTIGLLLFIALKAVLLAPWKRGKKRNAFFIGAAVMVATAGMFDHFFWTLQGGLLLWWITFSLVPANEPSEERTA